MDSNFERQLLTTMFEGDLDLAKSFNRVGELRCAREHLQGALEKLEQIQALAAPNGARLCEPQPPELANGCGSQTRAPLKNITP